MKNKLNTTNGYRYKYKKYKKKYNNLLRQNYQFDINNELESLIKYIRRWDDPNYSGMQPDGLVKPRTAYENIISYKTTVDISQTAALILPKNLSLKSFTSDVDGITNFLKHFNFIESKKLDLQDPKYYRIEGSSNEHLKIHNEILKNFKTEPKYIMEIGFNSGVSAINFLSNTKNTVVVSFDIMLHDYCWYSKMFIDEKYPNRHILIAGDSLVQLKTFSYMSNIKFDLIFVDGDHNYYSAYGDVINSKLVSNENTIVIFDNIAPHAGCGIGPYLAMNQAIKENVINFIEHHETTDYKDGFAIFKYNFNKNGLDEVDHNKGNKVDYVKLERLYPVYKLTTILNKLQTKKITSNEQNSVKILLNYFKKYNLKTDDEFERLLNKINI